MLSDDHKLDIGGELRYFYEEFGIKRNIFNKDKLFSNQQREDIEGLLMQKTYYTEGSITGLYGTFSLNYYSDMWYACELCKLKQLDTDKWYNEPVFRGEGDSPTHALAALCIMLKEDSYLDESDIAYIKSLF